MIAYMKIATARLNRGFDILICKILELLFILDHYTFSRNLNESVGGEVL